MDRNEEQELLNIILEKIRQRVSRPMYDTWISPLSGQIVEDNTIVINAASEFAKKWVLKKYEHYFIEILKELTGQDFKLKVTYSQTKAERNESDSCSSINEEYMDSNKINGQQKYKRTSIKAPVIKPFSYSIRLRRENERITGRLKFPFV